jgi:hypothetical protein
MTGVVGAAGWGGTVIRVARAGRTISGAGAR